MGIFPASLLQRALCTRSPLTAVVGHSDASLLHWVPRTAFRGSDDIQVTKRAVQEPRLATYLLVLCRAPHSQGLCLSHRAEAVQPTLRVTRTLRELCPPPSPSLLSTDISQMSPQSQTAWSTGTGKIDKFSVVIEFIWGQKVPTISNKHDK